jgi:hypothetical protein
VPGDELGRQVGAGQVRAHDRLGQGEQAAVEFAPLQRATLYRLFEREDGVMRFVQGERLQAVRNALADPLGSGCGSRG